MQTSRARAEFLKRILCCDMTHQYICDMTHPCVPSDSIDGANEPRAGSVTRRYSRLRHPYMWHGPDLSVSATWLNKGGSASRKYSLLWHDASIWGTWHKRLGQTSGARAVLRKHVWHNTFICVTWLDHMCIMTHSYVWYDSFICVTWLIHMCAMTHSYVCHDAFPSVTWLIHICATWLNHTCATWLIHTNL